MKSLVAFSVAVAAAAGAATAATHYIPPFDEWIATVRGNNYTSDAEYAKRADIFSANMALAAAHNARNLSWTLGANTFADLTNDEFVRTYVTPKPRNTSAAPQPRVPISELSPALQEAVAGNRTGNPPVMDWCDMYGACQNPYQQAQCASGYAISTVEVVEATRYIQGGMLTPPGRYSAQSIVDCSFVGCMGSDPWDAAICADLMGYLPWAITYPYTGVQWSCLLPKPPATIITPPGFTSVPVQNELVLETAVFERPIVTQMNALGYDFQLYIGGVLNSFLTCPADLSSPQSLMLVGYNNLGHAGSLPYWRAMNSWGAGWGEMGFIRVAKGPAYNPVGMCGVQMFNMRAN